MKYIPVMLGLWTIFFNLNCMAQEKSSGEVILLGAIHDHSISQNYSFAKLKQIIAELKPDAILVELPIEWLNEDGTIQGVGPKSKYPDSQSESEAAWGYCQEKKIPCLPFDIKGRNGYTMPKPILLSESKSMALS